MVKAVIAHPFEIWAAGMRFILLQAGCKVVGHWPDGVQALAAADGAGADLLVIDSALVDQALRKNFTGKIVIVVDPGKDLSPHEFVKWDVEGMILSNARASDFADCVAGVRQGRRWLDPAVRGLLDLSQGKGAERWELSAREAEVARLAASGLTNKKIAQLLAVSDGTIKVHMHHILTKLHLASRIELSQRYGDQSQTF